MQVRDLHYLSAVVRNRRFGHAAKELGVSQPAISKAVRRLEGEFGTRLLHRSPKGVVPTQAGITLMKRIPQIEDAIESTHREIVDFASGNAGYVRIGANATMLAETLPRACAKLVAHFPRVKLKIVGDMYDNLLKALRNGELDFFVSGLPEHAPQDVVQEPLSKDELAIVTRIGHPLAELRNCSLKELARLGWALPSKPVFSRELLERSFEAAGQPVPQPVIESNSVQMLLTTVARTDLATFQPIFNVRAASHLKLTTVKIRGVRWKRTIGINYRKDIYLPPAALKVISILHGKS